MRSRRWPTTGDLALAAWGRLERAALIHSDSRRARRFAAFGPGSAICFPPAALYGEHAIRIGAEVLIGPYVGLSAGMIPGQELLNDHIVEIGDRCLIGRGSSIVGHLEIRIGADVYFGPNVYVTDQNHSIDRLDVPIGRQSEPERPVSIGEGSWLGTNAVVLPGVTIGRHVAVGAGSVVTADLPDGVVAAGVPARIIKDAPPGDGNGSVS